MKALGFVAAVACIMMATPVGGRAQTSAQVTLSVPIDLTNLSPDITKVLVICTVQSEAITNGDQFKTIRTEQELPVSGGTIRTSASVVFSFTDLDNPVGKSASAECTLRGWSESQKRYAEFFPQQTDAQFRTNVQLLPVKATFVW